jgi:hypothetical protein
LTKLERDFGIKFTTQKLPPEEEAIALRSKRIMKELTERASVAEIGQHVSAAQEILGSPSASQVVAYLLKSYFNTQASDAERRSRSAQDREPGREREPERERERDRGPRPPRGDRPERSAEPRGDRSVAPRADSAAGPEGEGGRRRRRRRRGRGRGERTDNGTYMETLDAAELLAREPGAPSPSPMPEGGEVGNAHTNGAAPAAPGIPAIDVVEEGFKRMRVNIGFDDGFKGKGAVAKKIASLAGLNEGIVQEVEARRDHSVLKATPEIAELVLERVDGATIGKKVVVIAVAGQ